MTRAVVAASAAFVAMVYVGPIGEAHKGITSRFTYNGEVYPIFLERCGRCHRTGGVGPMSLLSYEDAFPWSESLRAELLDEEGTTPANPAQTDFVRTAHHDISARDLDMVLEWANGGTPEGNGAKAVPAQFDAGWPDGEPQLAVANPSPFEMPPNVMDATQELLFPTNLNGPREIVAIDLLPGTPAIVRDVVISMRPRSGPAKALATWTPRQKPARIKVAPPVRLAPGDEIVARVHYKKTWKYEGQALSDRSTIGLYFSR